MKPRTARRQLADATLQLLVQNQLLAGLRKDLLRIAQRIPPGDLAARELRQQLRTLACRSIDWEKYDRQFGAIYPGFLYGLIERAPELTEMEVRICTMLRMKLKSREMANLFGISEREVRSYRRNIRRKLQMKREEKLPLVLGAM
jgi:DNA-binding CsgD family transcriptional regulator